MSEFEDAARERARIMQRLQRRNGVPGDALRELAEGLERTKHELTKHGGHDREERR